MIRKLGLSLIGLGMLYTPVAIPAEQELFFGSVAMDVPAQMFRRLGPLTKYLSEQLNVPVTLKLSPDMGSAIKDASNGTVDFAYLTPVAYLKAKAQGDVKLVAKMVTNGKASFQLVIAVKENSPIKTVQDLEGKRFAFGDKAAILQRAVVVGAGMPVEKLGSYAFIGHYDNIARGVMNGDFDAGILKDTTASAWDGKGLRVIYSSPPLPPYNIVAAKTVDDKIVVAAREALLKLDFRNLAHQPIIAALDPEYDGFTRASDEEYEVVRKLIKPFAN